MLGTHIWICYLVAICTLPVIVATRWNLNYINNLGKDFCKEIIYDHTVLALSLSFEGVCNLLLPLCFIYWNI